MAKFDSNININTSAIKNTLLNFIVPIISLGVSALLFLLIIFPSVKAYPTLQKELEQKEALQDTLSAKLLTLNRLVDFKSIVDENSDLVSRILPSEEKVPYLLNQVDTIARESGVDVSKLSYSLGGSKSDSEGGATFNTVLVSLGGSGSYSQMVSFLKSMENAARLVNVTNFRFSTSTSHDDSGLYGMSFSVEAPYLFVKSSAVTDDPVSLDISGTAFVNTINKIKEFKYYDSIVSNTEITVEEDILIDENVEEVAESTESAEVSPTE